jgi:hypothetical protein
MDLRVGGAVFDSNTVHSADAVAMTSLEQKSENHVASSRSYQLQAVHEPDIHPHVRTPNEPGIFERKEGLR